MLQSNSLFGFSSYLFIISFRSFFFFLSFFLYFFIFFFLSSFLSSFLPSFLSLCIQKSRTNQLCSLVITLAPLFHPFLCSQMNSSFLSLILSFRFVLYLFVLSFPFLQCVSLVNAQTTASLRWRQRRVRRRSNIDYSCLMDFLVFLFLDVMQILLLPTPP